MDRNEIKTLLPHREPMLLLDSVEKIGEKAKGSYRVQGDEFFLQGHFPGNPVVPGVILCEILAQSACILLQDGLEEGMTPMYTGIDKVRFRRPVRPGEVIETCCRIKRAKHPFYFAEGSAAVNGELCVSGEFAFALVKGE